MEGGQAEEGVLREGDVAFNDLSPIYKELAVYWLEPMSSGYINFLGGADRSTPSGTHL